jgi:uncharacterized membrane protein
LAQRPSYNTGMPNSSEGRIQSVDALRGAIIILMALDHVRDYTSIAAMSFSPTDLSRTTAALFFTRWVTHFCAPVFAFTAGIGAFFWQQRGRTPGQLSRFLLTRGLWLMFLEITLLRFLMFFEWRFRGALVFLTVFWMLGLCMVVLAALVHLPARVLAPAGILLIALHNLLDPITAQRFGRAAGLWAILHQQAVFAIDGANFLVAYPLVPWVAVMALGFAFGRILMEDPLRRQRFLVTAGAALTVGFVVLRAWNRYGDPAPWAAGPSALLTALSFLNATKYPPSLVFLLMTLGPALLALAFLERARFSRANPLIVFGRVPFFFFLFHLAVGHLLAVALNAARFGPHGFLLLPAPSLGGPRELFPADYGFSLPVVYLAWIAVVAIAYPVCRWYGEVKERRRDLWWLSYL